MSKSAATVGEHERENLLAFRLRRIRYRVFPKEGEEPARPTSDPEQAASFRPDGVPRPCEEARLDFMAPERPEGDEDDSAMD
jgi:hypothetical protein